MTTDELIQQAHKLLAECTPRPWVFGHLGQLGIPDITAPKDGEFIAFARNHLGEILDLVDRLKLVAEHARKHHVADCDGSIKFKTCTCVAAQADAILRGADEK